jgi:hypothetical protein
MSQWQYEEKMGQGLHLSVWQRLEVAPCQEGQRTWTVLLMTEVTKSIGFGCFEQQKQNHPVVSWKLR